MVCSQRDFCEIGYEDQKQHRKSGHDEPTGDDECDRHKSSLEDRPADFVDDVGQDALVDRPPVLDQRHNIR